MALGHGGGHFPKNPLSLTGTMVAKQGGDGIKVKPVFDLTKNDPSVNEVKADFSNWINVMRKGEPKSLSHLDPNNERNMLSFIDEQIEVTNKLYHRVEQASEETIKQFKKSVLDEKEKVNPFLLNSILSLGREPSNMTSDFKIDFDNIRANFTPTHMSPVRYQGEGQASLLNTITMPFDRGQSTVFSALGGGLGEMESSMLKVLNDPTHEWLNMKSRQSSQMFVPIPNPNANPNDSSRRNSDEQGSPVPKPKPQKS